VIPIRCSEEEKREGGSGFRDDVIVEIAD